MRMKLRGKIVVNFHWRVNQFRVNFQDVKIGLGLGCTQEILDRGLKRVDLLDRRIVLQGAGDGGTKANPRTIMHCRPNGLDVGVNMKKYS